MDDRIFWLQLMLWMMLGVDYTFRIWQRQLQALEVLGVILAAGVLLSTYALYLAYSPDSQQTSEIEHRRYFARPR